MFRRTVSKWCVGVPPTSTAAIPTATGGRTLQFGDDARELMLNGVKNIAKAVGVTLGPKGRNVVIRQPNGEPKITKDGVTVARSIQFDNQFEDVGARLIRQVAGKTNDVAGDGTTTATILAWSIFEEGYKCVATGANPMDLKRGIDAAAQEILKSLRSQRRPVNDLATLENVATISANGERPLGVLIAGAVQSVGVNGFIQVLDGSSPKTEWCKYDGWSTERGFVSSQLVTDPSELRSTLPNPLVFVTEQPFESLDGILKLLEAAKAAGKPLVLVAQRVSDDVLSTIVANHLHGVVQCGVVTYEPTRGEFDDLAASCGCAVELVESIGRVSDAATLMGQATKFEQTMDNTVISGTADVSGRIRILQGKYDRSLMDTEKETLRERMAKLARNFGVIRVGGRTAIEVSESKDRVIDALNAARNALADGIVAGGGAALIHAIKHLDKLLLEDESLADDRRTGMLIVRDAARLPMKMIASNAGVEGSVIVEEVLESTDTAFGYDAQNDKFVNMFDAGIVDPLKVVASCVSDAASIVGLMITTEVSICDHTDKILLPRD